MVLIAHKKIKKKTTTTKKTTNQHNKLIKILILRQLYLITFDSVVSILCKILWYPWGTKIATDAPTIGFNVRIAFLKALEMDHFHDFSLGREKLTSSLFVRKKKTKKHPTFKERKDSQFWKFVKMHNCFTKNKPMVKCTSDWFLCYTFESLNTK